MEKIIDEIKKIKRVEYARGYQDGLLAQKHFEEQFEKVAKAVAEETAQEKRDRIVRQAKADIESLKGRCRGVWYGSIDDLYHISDGSYSGSYALRAKFVINKHKRTVVVLMYGAFSNKVRSRGIAKCAPGDCFNEHIGKAIALHRALGLDIPKEYLNAPNPTEVRVGNILITYRGHRDVVSTGREVVPGKSCQVGSGIAEHKSTKIIDDSVSIKEGTEC